MTLDKRTVFTDALETLGTIIDETAKRDAIHLAVEPVVAKELLFPGDDVTVDGRKPQSGENTVGIVDPFLKKSGVGPGGRFWLVLYPRQITSLRHVWEHPAFPPSEVQVIETTEEMNYGFNNVSFGSCDRTRSEASIEASKKWIQEFVIKCQEHENDFDYNYVTYKNLTYETLMNHAACWIDHQGKYPDYFYVSESLRDQGLPQEFWHHYEIVTGKKVEECKKRDFFTCSC